MAIIYPDTWASLDYPNLRFSLLETLKDIIESKYQKLVSEFDIDDVFHLFFNYTDLGESASSCVPTILFDAHEAIVVSDVAIELNTISQILGDAVTKDYLIHCSWRRVVTLAEEALIVLGKKGGPIVYGSQEVI